MNTSYLTAVAGIWAWLIFKITTTNANHTGFPIWIFYLIVIAVPPLVWLNRNNKLMVVSVILVAVFHVALLFAMNRTNTLIEYEVWLERKMPDRPATLRKLLVQKSDPL